MMLLLFLPDNKFYGSLPSRVRPKRANSEPSNINNSVEMPRLPMNTSHGDLFQNAVVHRTRGFNEPPPSLSYAPHPFDSVFPIENGSSSASTPQPSPPPPYASVPASAPPQSDHDTSDRKCISIRSFRRRKGLGIFNFGKQDHIDCYAFLYFSFTYSEQIYNSDFNMIQFSFTDNVNIEVDSDK
jgi:hypothetical protein